MKCYTTNKDGVFICTEKTLEKDERIEMNLIKAYPEVRYQEVLGMGGALTEAAAYTYSRMSDEKKKELIGLYFGEKGNRYNFCRTHVQSCDFALGNYAYVEDQDDSELKTFSIERDKQYIIPFIHEAQKKEKDLCFLASPWSPPAFMKTNGDMNHGGKLKKEYYGMWAKMVARYISEYEKEGIKISRLTVQNEPNATQTWDSCLFTGSEEQEYVCNYLRAALDQEGHNDVKINVWDHNKERVLDRALESLSTEEAEKKIDGIAFHWYTGDHFEALAEVRNRFPEKELIFTEGCVEYSRFASDNQVAHAEMYAHDILGNFNAGMNAYLDWNIYLDELGGPNHVKNYCDAPVMCDTKNDTIDVKLSYYYIGHFSRFIKRGAKRMLVSRFTSKVEACGFVNPDGEKIMILLNCTDDTQAFTFCESGMKCDMEIPAHSIQTLCW